MTLPWHIYCSHLYDVVMSRAGVDTNVTSTYVTTCVAYWRACCRRRCWQPEALTTNTASWWCWLNCASTHIMTWFVLMERNVDVCDALSWHIYCCHLYDVVMSREGVDTNVTSTYVTTCVAYWRACCRRRCWQPEALTTNTASWWCWLNCASTHIMTWFVLMERNVDVCDDPFHRWHPCCWRLLTTKNRRQHNCVILMLTQLLHRQIVWRFLVCVCVFRDPGKTGHAPPPPILKRRIILFHCELVPNLS